MIKILTVDSLESVAAVRSLVRAHILSSSRVHDAEAADAIVAALPAPYVAPTGALWVAWAGAAPVGCAGLQAISPGMAELKRVYVRPDHRGLTVGRRLVTHAIAAARAHGFVALRLGTLTTACAAQALYESVGFRRIRPYRPVEFGETWFYEMALDVPIRPTTHPSLDRA